MWWCYFSVIENQICCLILFYAQYIEITTLITNTKIKDSLDHEQGPDLLTNPAPLQNGKEGILALYSVWNLPLVNWTSFRATVPFNSMLSSTEAYLGHCQTSMMELFYESSERLLTVNYFHKKAPSWMPLQKLLRALESIEIKGEHCPDMS